VSPRTDAAAWRRGNIPIPQAHLVGLGTGILLQVVTPWSPPWPAWIGQVCGWPLILAGLWLGAWAVRAAAAVDLERPSQLNDSGPYARSRNPMYVAWTVGYVGVALVAGTAWPLLLLPVDGSGSGSHLNSGLQGHNEVSGDAARRAASCWCAATLHLTLAVSRLSATIPRAASRPTTAPRPAPSPSRADVMPSEAAQGLMKGCGWHGMRGVSGEDRPCLPG